MSKNDSYLNDENLSLWDKYEQITFDSTTDLMNWVSDDKVNFTLSDKVYSAMIDCLRDDFYGVVVASLIVKDGSEISVIIRKPNFQKILSSYTQRLLQKEDYEKLSKIKNEVEQFGLELI